MAVPRDAGQGLAGCWKAGQNPPATVQPFRVTLVKMDMAFSERYESRKSAMQPGVFS